MQLWRPLVAILVNIKLTQSGWGEGKSEKDILNKATLLSCQSNKSEAATHVLPMSTGKTKLQNVADVCAEKEGGCFYTYCSARIDH